MTQFPFVHTISSPFEEQYRYRTLELVHAHSVACVKRRPSGVSMPSDTFLLYPLLYPDLNSFLKSLSYLAKLITLVVHLKSSIVLGPSIPLKLVQGPCIFLILLEPADTRIRHIIVFVKGGREGEILTK